MGPTRSRTYARAKAPHRTTVRKRRHPNYRLVKIHRSYVVEEIADLFGCHKNTVRQWIRDGLPVCDRRRPILVMGSDLRTFLEARRTTKKRPCGPGEIYCVRCRATKVPAGGMVEYQPSTGTLGNLIAICPDCGSLMNRRVNVAQLSQFPREIAVPFAQAPQRVSEIDQPSVNSDFRKEN